MYQKPPLPIITPRISATGGGSSNRKRSHFVTEMRPPSNVESNLCNRLLQVFENVLGQLLDILLIDVGS